MFEVLRSRQIVVVLALAAATAGCGKPENDGYTQSTTATPAQGELKTPTPALPAWAAGLVGHPLSAITKGPVSCRGYIDTVVKHTGAKPGAVLEGWGWDLRGAKPLARVVFIDSSNTVVGAGDVGAPRPDVRRALPMVTSPAVGWSGVARTTSGMISAVGLTASDQSCVLGSRAI